MKEKFKCPICGHINFARQSTLGVPFTCEKCDNDLVIEEEEDDDDDDE